jgi:hypothetical protein
MVAPRHGGHRLWQWSFTEFHEMMLRAAGQPSVFEGVFQRTSHLTTGSSGSCPPIRTAVVSGDTVASATVRRRQQRSISKITLTSASKMLHDRFDLIYRHQTRLRGCRCDRLSLMRLIRVVVRSHSNIGYRTKKRDPVDPPSLLTEDTGRQGLGWAPRQLRWPR